VYVINGVVNCSKSDVHFVNNTGLQGGAMALIGSSTMVVGPCKYEFINNTAIHQGGAIYVSLTDSTDFITSRS
jgi:predicted outer membrane repeat protein